MFSLIGMVGYLEKPAAHEASGVFQLNLLGFPATYIMHHDELFFFLPLFQACVDPNTKDELHMVEMEGQDSEGQKIKAVLVSLKPSTLPSVSK